MTYSPRDLDLVFGDLSIGTTPTERAATSHARFVRSQLQLAPYSPEASGRVLSAAEALSAFGWPTLLRASKEDGAPLLVSVDEPSATLRARREELGLSLEDLSRRTKVALAALRQAETIGARTPIRILETIGQALALDERKLGFVVGAERDSALGVRLREMANRGDLASFTAATVLQLSEAAWVVRRQALLQKLLGTEGGTRVQQPQHDNNFGYPAYEIGYRLAKQARRLLGIVDDSPIQSVRVLVEDVLAIPLVQQRMDSRLAGATLANGRSRGIVINDVGLNSNVWVRRMTLCHELGHLLWDPDDSLQQVTVDNYTDIEQVEGYLRNDAPEMRANAFAVAFLAPPDAVRKIALDTRDPVATVNTVVTTFGISQTAAKYLVRNLTGLDTFAYQYSPIEPDDHWVAMENLTLDFFPIPDAPVSRRGRFAWCVARLFESGQVSLDSAASFLGVPSESLRSESLLKILDLRGPASLSGAA